MVSLVARSQKSAGQSNGLRQYSGLQTHSAPSSERMLSSGHGDGLGGGSSIIGEDNATETKRVYLKNDSEPTVKIFDKLFWQGFQNLMLSHT